MDVSEQRVAGRVPQIRPIEDADHDRDHEDDQGGAEQIANPGRGSTHQNLTFSGWANYGYSGSPLTGPRAATAPLT